MRAVALSLLAVCALATGEAPDLVFVFGGQSNMRGAHNDPAQLPEEWRNWSGILRREKGSWRPFIPEKEVGPEVSFLVSAARALAPRRIGMAKVSKGGTSLAQDWQADGGMGQAWAPVLTDLAGSGVPLAGLLWMQGERDARDETAAAAYRANFAAFVTRSRELGQAPELPVIFGRINPGAQKYPFVAQVRAAQEGSGIPRAVMVDCDGLGKHGDGVHYDLAGQIELGRRMWAAWSGLQVEQPAAR